MTAEELAAELAYARHCLDVALRHLGELEVERAETALWAWESAGLALPGLRLPLSHDLLQ